MNCYIYPYQFQWGGPSKCQRLDYLKKVIQSHPQNFKDYNFFKPFLIKNNFN